jgi:hypothetical protein
MAARFASVIARVRSGALPKQGVKKPRSDENTRHTRGSPSPGTSSLRLPRSFGWLVRLGSEAACYRSQLQYLLSDPEIAALLAAAPQVGRVLRPLCHMLGLRVRQWPALCLPVRRQPARLPPPSGDPEPPTSPSGFPGPSPTPLGRTPSPRWLEAEPSETLPPAAPA